MTGEEKEIIRKHVKGEISSLEKSVITLTELLDSEIQSDANDWFTTKDSNPSKDINEISLAKTRQKIMMLKEILNHIDSPDYGICVICDKPIAFERMKAVPSATRCVSCL